MVFSDWISFIISVPYWLKIFPAFPALVHTQTCSELLT